MKTKSLLTLIAVTALLLAPMAQVSASSIGTAMSLVSMLSKELGVTDQQAQGGAGAILGYAKDQLSEDDFTQVADAVPGMDGLLDAAPEAGALGKLAKLGGADTGDSSLGGLASLAGSFTKLDLDSGMIGKFVPVILNYVESNGSTGAMNILSSVLK